MTPKSPRQDGFTILEIMIATAILVVGLMGLLALFPVAMRSGTMTIEETNAALIARSVEQAIREGVQNRKGQDETGRWTYFLLQHDGVEDPLPRKISDAAPSSDYFVLFPTPDTDSSRQTLDRTAAYRRGKTFVYPESDGLEWSVSIGGVATSEEDTNAGADPNGTGNPLLADDDGNDYFDSDSGEGDYEVFRTYHLTNRFVSEQAIEGLSEEQIALGRDDPISQYSFAFALRPAYRDASLGRQDPNMGELIPSGELYEAEILVFRSFMRGTAGSRKPILRKTILVHR